VSARSSALILALLGLLVAACAGAPAAPRVTAPPTTHALSAVPADVGAATPERSKPTPERSKPTPTPRPRAMSDAEWRVAFCQTQDVVFALQFAIDNVVDASRNVAAFKRAIRILGNRAQRARRVLRSVPARYARPLVTVEHAFLRSLEQYADVGASVLRHPTTSGIRSLQAVGRRADRQWDQMVRANRRMHESRHRLVCL
jgi:hypothetical protein